jgi:hypothetical protein
MIILDGGVGSVRRGQDAATGDITPNVPHPTAQSSLDAPKGTDDRIKQR